MKANPLVMLVFLGAGVSHCVAANPEPSDQQPTAAVDLNQLEDGVVTGVLVRASDGSPVADATVILHTGGSNKTKSDVQGRFRLENVRLSTWAYPLWAHQGNLITKVVNVIPLQTPNPKEAKFAPIRLEMNDGKQAQFLVKSAFTQKPIAGAAVRFGYPDRRLVTTDENGTAIVQGLMTKWPFKGGYDVTIEAEGYARCAQQLELSSSEPITKLAVQLAAGGVVRGKVLDNEGRPVPEAEIVYRISDGIGFHGDAFRSDAEGTFRHRFLPLDASIQVSARKKDFLPEKQDVTLSQQQRELEIQFILQRRPKGGSVIGVVTDDGGTPMIGAAVTNHGNNGEDKHEVKTDAQGKFVIHDMFRVLNRYEVGVAMKGFAPQLIEVNPGTAMEPTAMSVVLKPGHTIRGQVKLESGQPAKGATVSIRSSAFHHGLGQWFTVDDEGMFRLDSLPHDVRFDVQLRGYAEKQNIPLVLDTADPVVVTLESPGIIRGRVIDAETKKPIPQFRVRLGFSRIREPGDAQGTYGSHWSQAGVTFESDDGKFAAEPLTNGMPFELIVEADGYSRQVIKRVVATKGEDAKEAEVSLKSNDPKKAYTLIGQFIDHQGNPKSDAQLRLIVSTDQPTGISDNDFNWVLIKGGQLAQKSYCEQFLSGVTDAKGRFEFKGILPGKHLQLAYWGAGVPQGKSLAFDETKSEASDDVTIRLTAPAQIRVTIARAKFADAGSVRLSLNVSTWHDYEVQLGEGQEAVEFNDLPAGDYSLTIGSKPVQFNENGNTFFRVSSLARQKIKLKPGQVETVSFVTPDPPQSQRK